MRTALRLHRYPQWAVGLGLLLGIGLRFSQQIDLPAADAPRLAREMVLALAPGLLGVVALPVAGELELTVRRGPAWACLGAFATVSGPLLLGAVLWPRGGVLGLRLEYKLTVALLLSSTTVVLARRLGTQGLIVAAIGGLITALNWYTFADLLGFGPFGSDELPRFHTPWGAHASCLAALMLAGYAVALEPRRTTSAPSD